LTADVLGIPGRGKLTEMEFYVLARKESSEYGSEYDTEFLAAEDANYGEAPRCPVCGRFTGGRQWLPPLRVELELHGRQFGDVLTGSGGSTCLCRRGSRRSIDRTGWSGSKDSSRSRS